MIDYLTSKYLRYHDTGRPIVAMDANWPDNSISTSHSHPQAQLLFAISGVMVVRTGLHSWVIPSSRALWLPPGIEHEVEMHGEVQMRTVYVDTRQVPSLPTKTRAINVSNLLIELIIQAVLVHADYTKGSRSDLVLRLLAEEIRVSDELPFYLPTPRDKRIALISTTLRDNPDNILTISEWAEKTGLASRTILRLFLKETGMTFSAWRTQARLLNALKRIASGEKIIDIAYQCGYASPSAFTAMFKRYFGVPPSSFYKPGKK